MSLTKEEVSARQSIGAHIGFIRRIARQCKIDPDEIIFKNPDGSWSPGKMLLENELPKEWIEELEEHKRRMREEQEWADLVQGYAKQAGLTVEEVVRRVRASIDQITEDVKEILDA